MRRLTTPHLVLAGLAALAVAVGAAEGLVFAPRPARDGRVHITYWEKWSGFEFDAIRDAVDAYNRTEGKEDGVYVDLVNVSQVDRKLLLAVAGEHPPDLAGNWSIHVAPFAEKEALTPLDDFIARDPDPKVKLDALVPGYVETCRYGGRLWALPIVPATTALFYNRRLFREAGLPDRGPRTLEELDEWARRLDRFDDKGNLVQAGFLHTEPDWWRWCWGYYFGGRLTDGKGTVLPEPEPWVRALTWIDRCAERVGREKAGSVQTGPGKFDTPHNAFIAERVAMVMQGVWMPNFISRYNRGLEYGVAPFPAEKRDPKNPVTQVETDAITMPKGCRHPEAAWEFMKYVAFEKGAEILCAGQGKHTCLRRLTDEYVAANRNPHVRFFHALAFSERTYVVGKFPVYSRFRNEMAVAFDRVWQDERTPKEAVDEARALIQKDLDRNIERTGYTPPAQ